VKSGRQAVFAFSSFFIANFSFLICSNAFLAQAFPFLIIKAVAVVAHPSAAVLALVKLHTGFQIGGFKAVFGVFG
jgi:hypothetical protein